ncbi:hypothetical protein CAP35_06700 [Chitinophagaceae bacterium IBVUCB1]|nr:hypothetical protein CAP35_06700 [Chitinophagaceae bacterium IBVUCB1]
MTGNIKWLLASAMLLVTGNAIAQGSGSNSLNINSAPLVDKSKMVKKPKPLRTELSGGLRLNSDGWGVFVDKGWVRSEERYSDLFYNIRLFQIEFSERKHPKEAKRTTRLNVNSTENPAPFIYGKINNFYSFKLGYGNRKLIAGKPEPGTVSVHWVYLGGITLGLLKPYYIEVVQAGTSAIETIKYSEAQKNQFTDDRLIIGSAGFSQGLGELQVVPGIHFKTALHFDFAATKHSKLAIETGTNIEYYTSSIPMMVNQKETAYFINVYAALQFGKRW